MALMALLAAAYTVGLAAFAVVNKAATTKGKWGWGLRLGRPNNGSAQQEPARRSTQLDVSVAPMPSAT
jgi:hypothetical protein